MSGKTAKHVVGGVGVAGAPRDLAARIDGRGMEEAAPLNSGEEAPEMAFPTTCGLNLGCGGEVAAEVATKAEEMGVENGMTRGPGAD